MSATSNAKANCAGGAGTGELRRSTTAAACWTASPALSGPKLSSDSKARSSAGGRSYLTRAERTELALVEMIVGLRHLRDSLHRLGRLDLEPAQTRMMLARAIEFLDLIGNPKLD